MLYPVPTVKAVEQGNAAAVMGSMREGLTILLYLLLKLIFSFGISMILSYVHVSASSTSIVLHKANI